MTLTGRNTYFLVAILIILALPKNVSAQEITPRLLAVTGFDFEDSGVVVSMAVGESAVSTIASGSSIITQGFLQPELLGSPCDDVELVYFPNPVIDQVTIRDQLCGNIITRIELFDSTGKLVLDTPLQAGRTDLQLVGLGPFYVRAYGLEDRYLNSFKIVKITNN